MMLGMTEDGKLYQTASHRPDGKGFERMPVDVDVRDVCLDMAVYNHSALVDADHKVLSNQNLKENLQAEKEAMNWKNLRAKAAKIEAIKNELTINPEYQKQLQFDGILQNMTRSSDFNQLEISGYGLSSDGVRGPTKRQRACERAILEQMGAVPAASVPSVDEEIYSVDAAEKEQLQLQILADAYKKGLQESLYNKQDVKYVINPAAVRAVLPDTYADLESAKTETDVVAIPKFLKNPVVLIVGALLTAKILMK